MDDTSVHQREISAMTIPVVTECSKAPEPVERDTFADEPQRAAAAVTVPRRRLADA